MLSRGAPASAAWISKIRGSISSNKGEFVTSKEKRPPNTRVRECAGPIANADDLDVLAAIDLRIVPGMSGLLVAERPFRRAIHQQEITFNQTLRVTAYGLEDARPRHDQAEHDTAVPWKPHSPLSSGVHLLPKQRSWP